MADKELTFDEPEGFVPPENIGDDDTFQAMATFKVLPNDQLQLVDIEGYQVGEPPEEEGEGPESEEGTEAAQPLPAGASAGTPAGQGGGPPGPGGLGGFANRSEDRLAPGTNQTNARGFAEGLVQRFKKATGRR
jgi:hypothetical protein